MPTSFLDLPREIRDIIYGLALTSPTKHYHMTLRKSPPVLRLPSSTSVHLQACDPSTKFPLRPHSTPALALQRTCRQIYAETHDWVWSHNTVLFTCAGDAVAILKHMGQRASRRIQKVRIYIDRYDSNKKTLAGALSMLASRTRRGELRDVGLVLDLRLEESLISAPSTYIMLNSAFAVEMSRSMIYWLEKGAKAGWEGKVKRTLELRFDLKPFFLNAYDKRYLKTLNTVATDCHHAWGGKLTCNEEVIWDQGVKVGEISKVKPLPVGKGL